MHFSTTNGNCIFLIYPPFQFITHFPPNRRQIQKPFLNNESDFQSQRIAFLHDLTFAVDLVFLMSINLVFNVH